MEKNWYASRTIWVNLVAGLFALGTLMGFTPEGASQEEVVTAILGIQAGVNVLLRFFTDKPLV